MKKNEKIRYLVIILVLAIMFSGAASYATNYLFDSKDVYFDNTHSEIRAGNVQDALDEVFQHVTDYNEIKALIGDSTLTTTSQTLTGGINELNSKATKAGYVEITVPANGAATSHVTFTNPFPANTDYSVQVSQASTYAYVDIFLGSNSRTVNGFDVTASSSRSSSLTIQVMWTATPYNN